MLAEQDDSDESVQWAYVCGCHPMPFRNVEGRLLKLGINVSGHCDDPKDFGVPKKSTMILLVTDQVSHNISEKARDAADKLDIPIVAGPYKNWVNLETRIRARGLARHAELVAGGQEVIPEQSGNFPSTLGDRAGNKLIQMKEQAEREAAARAAEAERARLAAQKAAETGTPIVPTESEERRFEEKVVETATKVEEEPAVMEAAPAKRNTTAIAAERALIAEGLLKENRGFILNVHIQGAVKKATGGTMSMNVIRDLRKRLKVGTPPRGSGGAAWVEQNRKRVRLPPLKDAPKVTRGKGSDAPAAPRSSLSAVPTRRPVEVQKAAPAPDAAEREMDVIQAMLDEWVVKHAIGKLYLSFDKGEWDVNWDQVTVITREKKYTRKRRT